MHLQILLNVPWYQERLLHHTSLGSLMVAILIRTVKYNLSKLRVSNEMWLHLAFIWLPSFVVKSWCIFCLGYVCKWFYQILLVLCNYTFKTILDIKLWRELALYLYTPTLTLIDYEKLVHDLWSQPKLLFRSSACSVTKQFRTWTQVQRFNAI